MKVSKLRDILTKPSVDSSMDQMIIDTLLSYDANVDDENKARSMNRVYQFTQKPLSYGISKIAIAVLVLFIAGVGTVWAAGLFKVKSYKHEINLITEDEYDEAGYIPIDFEKVNKKYYGKDLNKLIVPRYSSNGKILEVDEDGYITLDDGSKYKPVDSYTPDPERYEKARVIGREVFAEMEYPDLMPTYIYNNYILSPEGFVYMRDPETSHEWFMVQFVTDDYEGGRFFDENIWITFNARKQSVEVPGSIRVVDDKDKYIYSSHTTKGGILCTIEQHTDSDHIIANLSFDSETIGNGDMMIEFDGIEWDKITEILDTLPLTDDNVDSHIANE